MPFSRINGAELYYEFHDFTDPWSKADTFLLQHGLFRSGRYYYKWVPLLAGRFKVLRPDLRGMGRSVLAPDLFEPATPTYVADLLGLLDHLGIEKVIYVGQSLGGILGLFFALAHPERVRAVVASAPLRPPLKEMVNKFPVKEESQKAALAKGVDYWSRQTLGQRFSLDLASPEYLEWSISEQAKTLPQNAVKLYEYASERLDFSPHLHELKVPALFLLGGKSSLIPPDQLALMRSGKADVKVVVFPGVGHDAQALIPEQFVKEILVFLKKRSIVPVD